MLEKTILSLISLSYILVILAVLIAFTYIYPAVIDYDAAVDPYLNLMDAEGKHLQPAAAMELPDGTIVTGRTSDLLGASSALLLNALKKIGGLPDDLHMLPPIVLEPIQNLKTNHLGNRNPRLHTDETLIALSISASTNPMAMHAMEQLSKLRGCDVHSSVILSQVDERTFKRLGVNLTCEPSYGGLV